MVRAQNNIYNASLDFGFDEHINTSLTLKGRKWVPNGHQLFYTSIDGLLRVILLVKIF